MSPTASRTSAKSRGVLTTGLIAVALSATGQPVEKQLARLAELGVPDLAGRAALHAVPVILIVVAVMLGRALGRGRSKLVRFVIYALAGAVAGFFTAYCLDLLAGIPATIEALNGPLEEPDAIETALWAFGGIGISMGIMVAVIAAFGPRGAYAMNFEEDCDPETLDIRKTERANFGLSSVGLAALGVASIALAIARQSGDGATLGPSIVALVAGAVTILLNILLWSRLDELQRRQVIDAYAVSAILLTLLAFGWAVAETLGLAPSFDASAIFVSIAVTQLVAGFVVTAALAGNDRAKRRLA